MWTKFLRILILFISTICIGQNYTYWTLDRDSLDRPTYCSYRLVKEMDTLNLGRHHFYGDSPFIFDGYDRGHLAPAAHFDFDSTGRKESFDYANIVPQTPFINRGLVKQIEQYERKLVDEIGCIYVVIKIMYGEKTSYFRKGYTCNLEDKLFSFDFIDID